MNITISDHAYHKFQKTRSLNDFASIIGFETMEDLIDFLEIEAAKQNKETFSLQETENQINSWK